MAARRIFESCKCAQERRKIGVEADDWPQEETRLKILHPKEECGVWLPRAQGSVIAARVRTSKEARPCGSDRDGGVCWPDFWDKKRRLSENLDMDDSNVNDFEDVVDRNAAVLTCARVHLEVFVSKESLQNPSSGVPDPDTARH